MLILKPCFHACADDKAHARIIPAAYGRPKAARLQLSRQVARSIDLIVAAPIYFAAEQRQANCLREAGQYPTCAPRREHAHWQSFAPNSRWFVEQRMQQHRRPAINVPKGVWRRE